MRRALKIAIAACALVLVPAGTAQATKTASPASLAFPQTAVGLSSAPQTITYSITADETSRTTDVRLDCVFGQSCPFRVTSDCPQNPVTFPPGDQSCTIQVYFQPFAAGGAAKTVVISTAAPIKAVPVSGVGIAAPTAGKGKKCEKKGRGKKSASAARKKCGKKK